MNQLLGKMYYVRDRHIDKLQCFQLANRLVDTNEEYESLESLILTQIELLDYFYEWFIGHQTVATAFSLLSYDALLRDLVFTTTV